MTTPTKPNTEVAKLEMVNANQRALINQLQIENEQLRKQLSLPTDLSTRKKRFQRLSTKTRKIPKEHDLC